MPPRVVHGRQCLSSFAQNKLSIQSELAAPKLHPTFAHFPRCVDNIRPG